MQFSAYVRMDGFNVVQNVHHVIRDGWNHPWAKEEYASFYVYHGQPTLASNQMLLLNREKRGRIPYMREESKDGTTYWMRALQRRGED